MNYYRLLNKKMPWHEYGEILLTGTTTQYERSGGLLQLARTGPFQPNMIIPGELLITNSMKVKLENSGFNNMEFVKVIKKHIVYLDWTHWNLNAEHPPIYPKYGDAENYLADQPHSPETAEKMEDLWEVIIPVNGAFENDLVLIVKDKSIDLMVTQKRNDNTSWFVVTEKMKNWLQENQADWISFEKINSK